MSKIDLRKLKETILQALESGGIGEGGFPIRRQAHKMNLIGRSYQSGELELTLGMTFTADDRSLAARAFDELKRDGFVVPNYDEIADPENWVFITDAGAEYLKRGLPERVNKHVSEVRPIPKLTLDTNCIINLFDSGALTPTSVEALTEIIRYSLSGKATIAITTRVEADLQSDRDPDRQAQMLRALAPLPVIGTIGRFDVSKWDSVDVYAGSESAKLTDDIQGILFPGLTQTDKHYKNKLMDIDHLVGHVINKQDIFVTDDTDILKKRDRLRVSPGITVMTPDECVAYLENIERQLVQKPFDTDSIPAGYHSPNLQGKATFDYSNNNGNYTIGESLSLFETHWSKASDTSIHAYTYSESIEGLALAKGARQISEIEDTTKLDYSSRSRTPNEGEIIVWRNTNGLYAATKILDVKDDSRDDDRDELTFEYVVLADGSTNFKKK